MLNPLVILLGAAVAAGNPAFRVTTLDGASVAGELAAWTPAGIVLHTAQGPQEFAPDALLSMAPAVVAESSPSPIPPRAPATPASITLSLVDGARLKISAYSETDDGVKVVLGDGRPLALPRSRVRAVEFQPRTDSAALVWRQVDGDDIHADWLVVIKQGGAALDALDGVVRSVSDEQIDFQWEGETIPVKRAKVAAIRYYQAAKANLPDPVCIFQLVDGSRIPARTLRLEQGVISAATPGGVPVRFKLADVALADFSAGKFAYLSDLAPLSVRWTPLVAMPAGVPSYAAAGLPRSDASFSRSAGPGLALAWGHAASTDAEDSSASKERLRVFKKGLAIRSRTELAYRVPANMRRFTAVAGIDPLTRDQGQVTLEIRGDDRVLWEGEIDGPAAPVEIEVELDGVRRLELRVDYGKNLDYGDRLHLADARFTK